MNLQKTHIYTKFPHTENTRNAHRQEYSVTLTTVFHSLQSCPITYKTHIATELVPGPKFGSKNSGRFKMKILADYAYTLGYGYNYSKFVIVTVLGIFTLFLVGGD